MRLPSEEPQDLRRRDLPRLVFKGESREEAEVFVKSVLRVFVRDASFTTERAKSAYIVDCFRGDALAWYLSFEEDFSNNSRGLLKALLKYQPGGVKKGNVPREGWVPTESETVESSTAAPSNVWGGISPLYWAILALLAFVGLYFFYPGGSPDSFTPTTTARENEATATTSTSASTTADIPSKSPSLDPSPFTYGVLRVVAAGSSLPYYVSRVTNDSGLYSITRHKHRGLRVDHLPKQNGLKILGSEVAGMDYLSVTWNIKGHNYAMSGKSYHKGGISATHALRARSYDSSYRIRDKNHITAATIWLLHNNATISIDGIHAFGKDYRAPELYLSRFDDMLYIFSDFERCRMDDECWAGQYSKAQLVLERF